MMKHFIIFVAFVVSLLSITAVVAQGGATPPPPGPPPQNDRIDAPALRSFVVGLGYEVKDLNKEAGKEKYEFTIVKGGLNIPTSAEISPSKNYIWLTVFLGETKPTTKFEQLLRQNGKAQPSNFYITSTGKLMMALAVDNRNVTSAILRRSIDKLTDDVVGSQEVWGK